MNGVVRITGMDHIVLVVDDVESVVTWYHEELGLAVLRRDEWRRGEVPFPSLRIDDSTIIDVISGDRNGENVNHLALVVEGVDIDELAASGRFVVEAGPADLFGARGTGRGLYTRDPAGNLVELRSYPA